MSRAAISVDRVKFNPEDNTEVDPLRCRKCGGQYAYRGVYHRLPDYKEHTQAHRRRYCPTLYKMTSEALAKVVIPVKTGIQRFCNILKRLDSHFRGNDKIGFRKTFARASSIYTDEDVDVLIKPLLKAKGFTLLTTLDEGMLGKSDREQLDHAIELKSIFLTHNRIKSLV